MYLFVVVAILNILLLLLSPTPDFKEIINIGERGALFLAAITGLVFTYAGALESSKKNTIIKSGESLFKSFLIFVISMIFSIVLKNSLINPTNSASLPALVFGFGIIVTFSLFVISLATIMVSGYYFAIGITGLMASFQRE